jgi:hypothetical protein
MRPLRMLPRQVLVMRNLFRPRLHEHETSGSSVHVKKSLARQPGSARVAACTFGARARISSRVPGRSLIVMTNLYGRVVG